jgi:hypothetical protein
MMTFSVPGCSEEQKHKNWVTWVSEDLRKPLCFASADHQIQAAFWSFDYF